LIWLEKYDPSIKKEAKSSPISEETQILFSNKLQWDQ